MALGLPGPPTAPIGLLGLGLGEDHIEVRVDPDEGLLAAGGARHLGEYRLAHPDIGSDRMAAAWTGDLDHAISSVCVCVGWMLNTHDHPHMHHAYHSIMDRKIVMKSTHSNITHVPIVFLSCNVFLQSNSMN